MIPKPEYFERIREGAAKRWDQLEHDPELAGPWHQLFKQVQSPRHIISELLQNADDAGATRASVHIENGIFVFRHNGEDFTEEHFASLCRFGYSNKRVLHTIGFRGIGFKSTFSLGDRVELSTPTLSVAFDSRRFTEPIWVDDAVQNGGLTQIRVKIRDHYRQNEVEKNITEWLKSPVSLLFFRSIRYIRIQEHEVQWRCLGPGPVENSEWVKLAGKGEKPFLLARSTFEEFPEEALAEIKDERMLSVGEDIDLPSCQVEIVLGAKGRLFVVLPTGVETKLPFACNGPFIQDPARLKIKDPEISPTNRWLLERIGKLATSAMVQWLENDLIGLAERAQAYDLLPDRSMGDSSLEGMCQTIVEGEFDVIENEKCLLTDQGILKAANQSIIVPKELLDVWPADNKSIILDNFNHPALSYYVSDTSRKILIKRNLIGEITESQVLSLLESKHLPKPESWDCLLKLWIYTASELIRYRSTLNKYKVCIIPVEGRDVLYSASEVVRLGERNILQSSEEWEFLATYLLVFNNDWTRFLAVRQQKAREWKDERLSDEVETAYAIMRAIGIEGSSDASQIIEKVSTEFFIQEKPRVSDCVRLAQIAAKLGAKVRTSFRFVTQDIHLHSTEDVILFDQDGSLEYLLSSYWAHSHLLHNDYSTFNSCTKEEWIRWISIGHAGLYTFVPPILKSLSIVGHQNIEHEIHSRGQSNVIFPYTSNKFEINDWNFEEIHWNHWQSLAKEDDKLWGRIVEHILAQPEDFWSKTISAKALQKNKSGGKKSVTSSPLVSEWILKLRDFPCLPDTRGFYRKPTELLRRTPETEPFMDVEPFIHGRLDNESNRQLLDLLGVSSTPMGPKRLLDCLRTLSRTNKPPIYEVEKWYRRLDLMADTCSTSNFLNIKKALYDEKLILTEDVDWVRASDVFLSSDEEDVPGAAVIRASMRELVIWRKIGVPERPTADLAIRWLQGLPSGQVLSQEDARRVRALLARHSVRVWNECRHWINLVGEWAPVDTIRYSISMHSLIPWSHLHEWVKKETVDFRLLAAITQEPPFSEIPALASHLEEHFNRPPAFKGHFEEKPWLKRLGLELCRIILDSEDNTARIRALAADLAETSWQTTKGLETIPYIKGTPAGTPRSIEVMWLDRVLYVDDLPNAKLARKVPEKLGKIFNHQDISAALSYCYGRSPEDVTEYIEGNFDLLERSEDELPIAEETIVVGGFSQKEPDSQDAKPVGMCSTEAQTYSVKQTNESGSTDLLVIQDAKPVGMCSTEAQTYSVKQTTASGSTDPLVLATESEERGNKIICEEPPVAIIKTREPTSSKLVKPVAEEVVVVGDFSQKEPGSQDAKPVGMCSTEAQTYSVKQTTASGSTDSLVLATESEERGNKMICEEPPVTIIKTREYTHSKPVKLSFIERFVRSLGYKKDKPVKPSFIERFARSMGYKKDGINRFYHADGSCIEKVNESSFPWEKRSASGDLIRYYWLKDHCLQQEPLQLEADVWGLIEKFPDTYSLVLSNPEGEPIEIPGRHLCTMREKGKITLYPSTYRIVYEVPSNRSR